MMNTFKTTPWDIMITHTDLDGVGCGILFKAVNGEKAEVHYCGYSTVDEKIAETLDQVQGRRIQPQIIVSDLGIKPETAERLDRYPGKKILLDHHKTNLWMNEKYDWALVDEEASGTLLVFSYLSGIPSRFRDFAIRVDDYDRWIHAYSESKRLNRLFYVLRRKRFEKRCLTVDNPLEFSKTDELLLQIDEDNFNHYVKKLEHKMVVFYVGKERRLGIAFADRYQSEAAQELMQAKKLDAIALIDPNTYTVSFRSKGNIDVGEIAKRLGGGGHRCASGTLFNYKTPITDFHGNKYPLYGLWDSVESARSELALKFSQKLESIESEEIEGLMDGGFDG